MKKLLLLTIFINLFSISHSQECNRSGSFVATGDEELVGIATIEVIDEKLVLSFSMDFSSAPGPDLDVYLSTTFEVTGTSLRLKALTSTSGYQFYEIPSGFGINAYDYVNVHCTQYNHLWGSAELGVPEGDCSSFLSDPIKDQVTELSVFPNPSSGTLNFSTSLFNGKVDLFSSTGQLVESFQVGGAPLTSVNISNLSTGLYFLKVTDVQGKIITSTKIMKQ